MKIVKFQWIIINESLVLVHVHFGCLLLHCMERSNPMSRVTISSFVSKRGGRWPILRRWFFRDSTRIFHKIPVSVDESANCIYIFLASRLELYNRTIQDLGTCHGSISSSTSSSGGAIHTFWIIHTWCTVAEQYFEKCNVDVQWAASEAERYKPQSFAYGGGHFRLSSCKYNCNTPGMLLKPRL